MTMKDNKIIKRRYRLFFKKVLLGVIVLFLLFLLWIVYGAWQTNSVIQEQRDIQERKVAQYEEKRENLSRSLSALQTEQGREDELIRTLPVKKPGEEVIILVAEEEHAPSTLQNRQEEKKSFSWWPF